MNWRVPRKVGGTAVSISGAGFGGASLAGLYGEADQALAEATVARALELGVTYFDVAPRYGLGVAETRLGNALAAVPRHEITLSTKVGWRLREGGREPDFTAEGVRRSLDGSLGRLRTDRVDIVYIHDPDNHEQAALDEVIPELVRWREQGIVGAIGLGMNHWQPLKRFVERAPVDCLLLANRYTLLEQGAAPLLDLCVERNVSVVVGGVFNTGILATGSAGGGHYDYKPAAPDVLGRVLALETICAMHGVMLPAAALQFPYRHPAVACVLVGAGKPDRFAGNIAALENPIPQAFWDELAERDLVALPTPANM